MDEVNQILAHLNRKQEHWASVMIGTGIRAPPTTDHRKRPHINVAFISSVTLLMRQLGEATLGLFKNGFVLYLYYVVNCR